MKVWGTAKASWLNKAMHHPHIAPEPSLGTGHITLNSLLKWAFYMPAGLIFLLSCNSGSMEYEEKWWTKADQELIISELNRTTEELKTEIEDLSGAQWHFREDSSRWSIAEITEHLELQNLLHYREISVISRSPQHLIFREITKGQDAYFSAYGTDTTAGKSQWYLEPKGKYELPAVGMEAFLKARYELTGFVSETEIDLRKQFTYRSEVQGKKPAELVIGQVRDLHQLLLTGIGHTDRHLRQIRKIKQHPDYPR